MPAAQCAKRSKRRGSSATSIRAAVTSLEIRSATRTDIATATRLLEAAGLPVDDIDRKKPGAFLAAAVGDTMVGFIGLEQFGSIGLLRSLIVEPAFRGSGLGRVLVAALESHACDRGVSELWLLTIDADQWFERLDYVARKRDDAPESIRDTEEFSGLCPDDAVLMSKTL